MFFHDFLLNRVLSLILSYSRGFCTCIAGKWCLCDFKNTQKPGLVLNSQSLVKVRRNLIDSLIQYMLIIEVNNSGGSCSLREFGEKIKRLRLAKKISSSEFCGDESE
ncbi:hypothetical protein B4W83_07765 [Streptococcus pseudopneumoniae ATCC BAA-960 = CCUG 49455]|nr:hypothetical protein B0177_01560 [Streptococcus pseudopneumoniae]ORC39448.1 hypothetical protein B4W83_07765 [Streptococcus pseudopneumoniae ATCC BAA-960 = CCUG 49455]